MTGMKNVKIISGSAHPQLAYEIAENLGIPVTEISSSQLLNRENVVTVRESIRGSRVYIVQTHAESEMRSVNDNLMELLLLADACKSLLASKITVVIPFFPYSRQDKMDNKLVPITAKLVASLLETAGVNQVITIDLHSDQICGFFNIPVKNLAIESILNQAICNEIYDRSNTIFVTPDAGGAKRCASLAEAFQVPMAVFHKERSEVNRVSNMFLVGDRNITGKDVVIIDDMADTCGTVLAAANILKQQHKVRKIIIAIVHPVFSTGAIDRLIESHVDVVIFANTIPIKVEKKYIRPDDNCIKFVDISVVNLLSDVIRSEF